jgi:hypothetical protein
MLGRESQVQQASNRFCSRMTKGDLLDRVYMLPVPQQTRRVVGGQGSPRSAHAQKVPCYDGWTRKPGTIGRKTGVKRLNLPDQMHMPVAVQKTMAN